ncbi:MAG: ABC transporter ATP-binding protein [Actinomycetota bacterium]
MTDSSTDAVVDSSAADALPTASGPEARRRLLRLLRDRPGRSLLVIVLAVLAVGVQLLGPALVGVVVDVIVDASTGDRSLSDARSTITLVGVAYAVSALVAAGLAWVGTIQTATLGESALAELRTEVFDHAVSVDVDRIERGGVGDLVARLGSDVQVLGKAVQQTVPQLLLAAVELVLTVVALVIVDARLAVIAIVAAIPATSIGLWWYARHAPGRYRAEREAVADLTDSLVEGYDGRRTLSAFRSGDDWRHLGVERGERVVATQMATASARNRLRPSVRVSLACSLVAVLVVGAGLVNDGTIALGALSAVALYVVRTFDPIGLILEQLDEIQQATAAAARLVGITQLETSERSGGRPDGAPSGRPGDGGAGAEIDVRSVTFGYGDRPVVHDLDLRVAPGQRVAVVGASGAGKSTLAKLIVGFHRPDAGAVRLVAESAGHAPSAVLVTQESHAFVRSIRDNVTVGRPDADDGEVERALRTVGAWEWVEQLDEGIHEVVGLKGSELDPVRRQQLALARLVCAEPDVVVLDEATASLDPIAAASTEVALDAALGGRTVIAVAHRLDVGARSDRVIVMDGGRIVADGAHEVLLETDATYASLWRGWSSQRSAPVDET